MFESSPIDSLSDILMEFPDLVLAFGEDERYLFINRAAANFLKTEPEDVIGYHWTELGFRPEVLAPLLEKVAEVYRSGQPTRYRAKSSPERGSRTFDMSLSPLRCDAGKLCAVLAVGHDISEFFPTD